MASNAGGIRAGRAFVELGTRDVNLASGLKRAQRRLRAFGAGIRSIGARLTAIASIPATAFGVSTRIFAGFDDRMRVVQAVTNATEDQFASLREEAKRLGRTTSFTAGQVAEAMTELGRAGFRPDAILTSTKAVLALARATSTELPRATEIAGAALRGFNLPVREMGRVTDVLTTTANSSAQTLDDLFEGLKLAAPIAVEAGESIEDVSAAMGVLANNGIKGSLAGTAIARAYKNLSSELKQVELKRFGVEVSDSLGNMRPLAEIINDLAKATQGLGSTKRLSLFESLFGRGQAAALKLASSSEAFDELRDKIQNSAGSAVRTAELMDAGIGGAFRRLFSALEGIGIAIGEAIEKPVRKAAAALAKVAAFVTKVVNKNRELIATLAKITAIALAVGTALIIVSVAVIGLGAVLGGLASIVSVAFAGLVLAKGVILALVSPLGILLISIATLGAVILTSTDVGVQALQWLGKQFGELRKTVGKVASGMANALAAGDLQLAAKILWLGLKVAWQQGVDDLSRIWLLAKRNFLTNATALGSGLVAIAQLSFHGIEIAWIEMNSVLSRSLSGLFNLLKRGWAGFTTWLAKRFIEIEGLADESIDVDSAKRFADQALQDRITEIDDETREQLNEAKTKRETDRRRAAEVNAATLAKIGQDFEEARDEFDKNADAGIDATRKKLDDARKELDQATADALKARQQSLVGDGTDAPGSGGLAERLQAQLAGIGSAIERSGSRVRGTFNASAIQGLLTASSVEERIAKATEENVKINKRVLEAIQTGSMRFT